MSLCNTDKCAAACQVSADVTKTGKKVCWSLSGQL